MINAYIYIDESGSLSKCEKYFCFAGFLVIGNERNEAIKRKMKQFENGHVSGEKIELKASDLSNDEKKRGLDRLKVENKFCICIENKHVLNTNQKNIDINFLKNDLLSIIITEVTDKFEFNTLDIYIDEQNFNGHASSDLFNQLYRTYSIGKMTKSGYIDCAQSIDSFKISYVDSRQYEQIRVADLLANQVLGQLNIGNDITKLCEIVILL